VPILTGAWIVTLITGQLALKQTILSTLLLPLINIFALSLPILVYARLSLHGLELPTSRRGWSVFGASLLIVPGLALVLEAVAIGIIVLLLFLYASTVPGLKETFNLLLDNVSSGAVSENELTRLAASLLFAPGASIALLSAFSIAIPLIEETFKLTVLYFYLGRLRRPVDGFVLGALCGIAFALAENIGFTSAGAADWSASSLARATSALPHIFNSGLLGWAVVSAWREQRYLRLVAAFFAVVLLHGTWNAVSLGLAMSNLSSYVTDTPFILQSEVPWAAAWGVLAIGAFFGLIYNNHQLRRLPQPETPEKVVYNQPLPGGDTLRETQLSGENTDGTAEIPD
jgi:RsiW-degrading membrane proteinase PrsW (M82 family)